MNLSKVFRAIHERRMSHSFIKNMYAVPCTKCTHFIEHPFLDPEESNFGKCRLFGEKDVVTGKIDYMYAYICRKDRSMCGVPALHYLEKVKKVPTEPV